MFKANYTINLGKSRFLFLERVFLTYFWIPLHNFIVIFLLFVFTGFGLVDRLRPFLSYLPVPCLYHHFLSRIKCVSIEALCPQLYIIHSPIKH